MPKPSAAIRVHVPLDPADRQGMDSEILLAERLGPDQFRILQSPLFVFDLSLGDTVQAEKSGDAFLFQQVTARGGHSTCRVYLLDDRALPDAEVQQALEDILAAGARLENANNRFFALDLPPGIDLERIFDLLEASESKGLWEFEESHYEPPTEAQPA